MGMDDVFSTESAFVATVTAAVFSPKTRDTLRKGAVYGLAGVLRAGDVAAGAARGAVRGIRGDGSGGANTARAGSSGSKSPSTARRASTRRAAATAKAARTETGT